MGMMVYNRYCFNGLDGGIDGVLAVAENLARTIRNG